MKSKNFSENVAIAMLAMTLAVVWFANVLGAYDA